MPWPDKAEKVPHGFTSPFLFVERRASVLIPLCPAPVVRSLFLLKHRWKFTGISSCLLYGKNPDYSEQLSENGCVFLNL